MSSCYGNKISDNEEGNLISKFPIPFLRIMVHTGVTVFIVPLKIMSPRTKFPSPLGQLSLGKTVPSLVKNVPLSYRYVSIKKFEKSVHTLPSHQSSVVLVVELIFKPRTY